MKILGQNKSNWKYDYKLNIFVKDILAQLFKTVQLFKLRYNDKRHRVNIYKCWVSDACVSNILPNCMIFFFAVNK